MVLMGFSKNKNLEDFALLVEKPQGLQCTEGQVLLWSVGHYMNRIGSILNGA